MKIIELEKVAVEKIGRVVHNGIKSEPYEESTASYLTQFGFTIEKVVPSSTPNTNSPDFFMNGAIWETKAPTTTNENTLKHHFHKASLQAKNSGRVIIDLRNVRRSPAEAEKIVVKLFGGNRNLRQMILIKGDGRVYHYFK